MAQVVLTGNEPRVEQPTLTRRPSKRWYIAAALITAIVALPVLSVLYLALFPDENIWPHLLETTLPR